MSIIVDLKPLAANYPTIEAFEFSVVREHNVAGQMLYSTTLIVNGDKPMALFRETDRAAIHVYLVLIEKYMGYLQEYGKTPFLMAALDLNLQPFSSLALFISAIGAAMMSGAEETNVGIEIDRISQGDVSGLVSSKGLRIDISGLNRVLQIITEEKLAAEQEGRDNIVLDELTTDIMKAVTKDLV